MQARRCQTRPWRSGWTNPIVHGGDHQGRPGDPDVARALARRRARVRIEAIARIGVATHANVAT
jgi:hypothetical protein